ncbi:MAG TPA: energy transducer TonB [Dokdonella sp.]|uniref:energy transducer TonB n=1 Tax=Dokdonella sp. TaxID=2291710 RepID=UPI002D7FD9AF|nr:energy transducer TonB [Dokdonella sp.]HET9032796.1 energy transducer TonB [Dokdonella sp.]
MAEQGVIAPLDINEGNHLIRSIRERLFWSPLLLCFLFAGCDGSAPGSTSAAQPESAASQAEGGPPIESPALPSPPVDSAPSEILEYRRKQRPKYSVQAVRERMEGKVILKVLVGPDGNPEEILLEKSSGYEDLDRSAITAVKTWAFNPGMKNGSAIRGYVLVPVEFNLGP